jgi:hypothetical protein
MADLTITAANVVAQTGSSTQDGTAGASITAGQPVYFDATTSTIKLAVSSSAAAAATRGIALHAAATGQPIKYLTAGPLTAGATLAVGKIYAVSGTAGGIQPQEDIGTGEFVTILGIATSTTTLNVTINASGVARA